MAAKAPTKLRPTSVKTWTIGEVQYTQDPLTFFEKNEFLGLIASGIDRALMLGLDVDALFSLLSLDRDTIDGIRQGNIDFTKLPSIPSLISVFTRLFSLVPDVLEEAYLILLSVPRADWVEVRAALRTIDDETGFGILDAFIEQNARTLADFLPRWRDQISTAATKLMPPKVISES